MQVMEKGCSIAINKTGNGFVITPLSAGATPIDITTAMVFNEIGSQYSRSSLLGFLDDHFKPLTGRDEE
jgi:hypothetical protein